jgi:membrane protein implicated in regulation of membrane protease activity
MSSTDPRWRAPKSDSGTIIEMTADGEFVSVRHTGAPPLSMKIIGIAVLVAVVAGGLAIAALALWLALTLIPIAIVGAAIAYGVFRLQLWRARRGSLGGQRDVTRP